MIDETMRHDEELARPQVGPIRLLVGLLQGLLLYGLYRAATDHAWPATAPMLFVALVLAGILGPVLLVSCIGHLPRRATALWVVSASAIAAALGAYDAWGQVANLVADRAGHVLHPSPTLCLATLAGFFIAHALIITGYAERRRIASYHGYFETAWKLGVQLGFSVMFVGATWLVLTLGAQLFMLVKLTLFKDIIGKPWFGIPVTVFAFTAAMHLTDVRPGIVRGIRSLLLTLMGWILPIAALIIAGFLVALPFTGLAPLWATRFASSLLLIATALLIILINAAWQNGAALPGAAAPIRAACRLACVLLLPLCLLAGYALSLRVADHGWTHDRIVATACLIVAFSYAAGYLGAAVRGAGLALIAPVNIATAFVVVAVLLSLFSPLANPQRLSVASQLARLDAGQVSAEKFDYAYLRFEGGRYGHDALAALDARTGLDAAAVRKGVAAARAQNSQYDRQKKETVTDAAIAANVTVWPVSARLPASFTSKTIATPRTYRTLPSCLTGADKCDAVLLDLVDDTRPEIVLIEQDKGGSAQVMGQDAKGNWIVVGHLPRGVGGCTDLRGAIIGGAVRAVAPPGKAVAFADKVVEVEYIERDPTPLCPAASAAPH
jgi:hypothetical protein